MVAPSFASIRAAVAVFLLVCSASTTTTASLVGAADTVPARELAADVSAFTPLDPVATLPLEVNADNAMVPPVSVSIVAPETMTTGISKLTTIGSAPAPSTAMATAVMTPVITKLTPSPSLARQNAAVAMKLESDVSTPAAAVATTSGTDTNSGSSTSVSRATSLKTSASTATTTKKPTNAPAHVSHSGSGSGAVASSTKSDDGSYESGSGSNRTYACACSNLRKVSLMGLADYCLAKSAVIGNKCGNRNVAENGECPRHGAMPCSDTGYVLTKDSLCLFDETDNVYKCVMSAEDLEIKKNGGKRKTKKSTASNATNSSDSLVKSDAALLRRASPAFHVITLVASTVLGIAALL